MRIIVGGFLHESHSFAPRPTRWADFLSPGGFPGFVTGAEVIPAVAPTAMPLAGVIAAAARDGIALVPTAWCIANPAGPVSDEAFERIAAAIVEPMARALDAGGVDGIYLDLHGAAVVDSFPDAEGELLRRVRAIAPDVPLTISLDPHCNLTQAMVDRVDALVPFRTYPHVDMRAAGAIALDLLRRRIARGKPWARAFRQIDYFISLPAQCTMVAPMLPVMEERARLAGGTEVAEVAFCFGFPYADFADCGAALAAYADTQEQADAAADAFRRFIDAAEASFQIAIEPAAETVAEAIRLAGSKPGPVVIADTQDNPGGGGHGDTTGLLAELIRQGAQGAVLGSINDAESAAACHAAGEGGTVTLELGGKSDGAPLRVTARVVRLSDGKFVAAGPMAKGNPAALGPTALIAIGGVEVIVASKKIQALDQMLFRHIGVDPAQARILALKSSVHFRADFQPIASAVLVAAAPGPVVADPGVLPFAHLRPGLRLRPMGNR